MYIYTFGLFCLVEMSTIMSGLCLNTLLGKCMFGDYVLCMFGEPLATGSSMEDPARNVENPNNRSLL